MTKYSTLNSEKQMGKKTVFTCCVEEGFTVVECRNEEPDEWDNVLYLGNDGDYGDVFKAWNSNSSHFMIYFGEKGDEFND